MILGTAIHTLRCEISRLAVGVATRANTTEPIAEEGWSSRCLSSRPSSAPGMPRNRVEEPKRPVHPHVRGQSNRTVAKPEETRSRWRLDRSGSLFAQCRINNRQGAARAETPRANLDLFLAILESYTISV